MDDSRLVVVLMRHGIAAEGSPDAERPLTDEGQKRTAAAAAGLAALGIRPATIFTSPLLRARQTAEIVAAAASKGQPRPRIVKTDALLPGAAPRRLWEEIGKGMTAGVVLCAGHLPHLDLAAADALDVSLNALGSFKKAGAAVIDFAGAPGRGRGTLAAWLPPRVLRRCARRRAKE